MHIFSASICLMELCEKKKQSLNVDFHWLYPLDGVSVSM
jgi:hypothetical protein